MRPRARESTVVAQTTYGQITPWLHISTLPNTWLLPKPTRSARTLLGHERLNCHGSIVEKITGCGLICRCSPETVTIYYFQLVHSFFPFFFCTLDVLLMGFPSTLCIFIFILLLDLNLALRVNSQERALVQTRRSFDLPIRRTALSERLLKRGVYSGSTGLGDFLDLCVLAF